MGKPEELLAKLTGEDERKKWDKCVSEGLLRFGGGLIIGSIASLLLMTEWPLIFCSGIGLALAYDNCDRHFKQPSKLIFENFKDK